MNRAKSIEVSYHIICPSHAIAVKILRFMEKMIESRVKGNQSNWTGVAVAKLADAATPRVLNIMEPIMVPSPMSEEFVMNVPIYVNFLLLID